mgnify:CR=1 FL=1
MGYRSEVHIAVPKKDEKKLDAIMNKHNLLKGDYPPFTKDVYIQKWRRRNNNNKIIEESTEYIIYQGSDLKWYEEYKDVNAVNSFIMDGESCDDNFEEGGRVMVCIGEDNAIHSDIGDYYYVFTVNVVVGLR